MRTKTTFVAILISAGIMLPEASAQASSPCERLCLHTITLRHAGVRTWSTPERFGAKQHVHVNVIVDDQPWLATEQGPNEYTLDYYGSGVVVRAQGKPRQAPMKFTVATTHRTRIQIVYSTSSDKTPDKGQP